MKLYHNDLLIGMLANYFYETPWASARITPHDPEVYRRLCQASLFLEHDADDEDDESYAGRLADFDISEDELGMIHDGGWEIREAPQADWNGPIRLARCDHNGWVEWRWGA